ncbi:MAG: energy transducer TonB [bacterium]
MKALQNNPTNFRSIPELVFLNRNKEYGAYTLRKSYNQHMTEALFISVLLFVATLMLPSILKKDVPEIIKEITIPAGREINLGEVSIEKPKTQFPVTQANTGVKPSIRFVAPDVVPDGNAADDSSIPTTDDMIGKTISTVTKEGDQNATEIIPIATVTDPVVNDTHVEEVIHSWSEFMPVYPGGAEALYQFIGNTVRYPEIARRANVQGKVMVQFVIEKDGSISNIIIMKGIGAGCDEEAIRVIQAAGRWIPGSQNGKNVRVKMVVPFIFKLS